MAELTVTPSDPSSCLTREKFSYLNAKIFEIAKELQSDDCLFEKILNDQLNSEDDDLNEDAIFCGRIFKETHKVKLDSESILFSPFNSGAKIPIDLSRVNDYSFFSGQMVALKGRLEEKLIVHQVIYDDLPLLPFPTTEFTFGDKVKICVVSGPFPDDVTTGLIQKLSVNLTAHEPDVLILLGPFVDENDPDLPKRTKIDDYLLSLIRTLREACPALTFLLVPSQNDFINENVIPAAPFDIEPGSLGPNVHLISNPGFVNISGIHLALFSCDILMHLVREEFHQSSTTPEGRMNRLCNHLIRQRSVYPLFPQSQDTNIDWSNYSYLKMPVRPHILIVPSILKGFYFEQQEVICLNPENIKKSTYAIIEIEKSKLTADCSSLTSAATTQLCKLE